MPKTLFDSIGKKRQRVPRELLEALESPRRVALKISPEPGVKTLVRPDSQKNLPTDLDRTPDSAAPLPGSAVPGGAGRDIPKFEFNTPDADSDITMRTLSEPGEEYGHPSNDTYNYVTRRTMTGSENEVEGEEGMDKEARWKRRWRPGQRQKRQRGRARMKSRQYYRKNRSKIRRKQKLRRRKPSYRNNPARKRSEKLRRRQNRRRVGSTQLVPCPACVSEMFMEKLSQHAPARERGGERGRPQRRQKRTEQREDQVYYRQNKGRIRPKSRRYYHTDCKPNPACMRRRKEYRKNPDYYERRAPKMGSVLTVPDIAFVIGPEMVLGYVDSISPMTGMVTLRLSETNVSQLSSLPVEVFLRAATLLSDEDITAFFELVDVEVGLEAYEDLDEEGLRECAGLYDVDPDEEQFKAKCMDLVGQGDISSMTAEQIETVNDELVTGVSEGGGDIERDTEQADDNDETIPDTFDPHLFYGEIEAQKT